MTGITKAFVSNRNRVYRTFSYQDKNKKPQHNRKIIATYDSNNNLEFNKYFMSLLYEQDISIDFIKSINIYDIPKYINFGENIYKKSSKSIKHGENISNGLLKPNKPLIDNFDNNWNSNTKNYENINLIISDNISIKYNYKSYLCRSAGQKILFTKIIEDIGLKNVLVSNFPGKWEQILTLAIFLVCENESVQNCHNWTEVTETFLDKLCLQSQRISELLSQIQFDDIMRFHESWASLRQEFEYLALDVTSISSWSKLINDVEYGYNRDGDKLPQVNICMLFGEKSGLPIYMANYSGSINDVKLLKSFISQINFLNNKCRKFVTDKEFYSAKNIPFLFEKVPEYKFLIAIPFTNNNAKQIVDQGLNNFDNSKMFKINNEILLGYSFSQDISINDRIYYHVFFNEDIKNKNLLKKKNEVIDLKLTAQENPAKYSKMKEFNKYLLFKKDDQTNKYDITIKYDVIVHELRNNGYLIIVGNEKDVNYVDVITIYRNKDVIEKSFNRLKNNLDLKRTKIHSDKQLKSKLFICFIALILNSYIHKTMFDNNLYNKYTMTELLHELKKITKLNFNNNEFYNEMSKNNLEILKCFKIKIA
jgi:transposase